MRRFVMGVDIACFKQLLDRNNRHFYVLLRFFHHSSFGDAIPFHIKDFEGDTDTADVVLCV